MIDAIKDLFEHELVKSMAITKHQWHSPRLFACMRYALADGKRLRPLMVLSSALAMDDEPLSTVMRKAMPAALAVEYVHTYSLIHDDLPSMDNDDFRRGRLSAHRQFDEALAILAGDALLADAFLQSLMSPNNAHLIAMELALASGSHGLVAGQSEDLNPLHKPGDMKNWRQINQAKTSRLFEAAAVMGGLSNNANKDNIAALRDFAQAFGEAFQMTDDMHDGQGRATYKTNAELLEERAHLLNRATDAANQLCRPDLLHNLIHLAFASS